MIVNPLVIYIYLKVHDAEKEEAAAAQKVEAHETLCNKLQEKIKSYETNFEQEKQQHK